MAALSVQRPGAGWRRGTPGRQTRLGGGAQARIGADAAADADLLGAARLRGVRGLLHQHIHHGLLKGCRQIGQQPGVVQIEALGRQIVGEVQRPPSSSPKS